MYSVFVGVYVVRGLYSQFLCSVVRGLYSQFLLWCSVVRGLYSQFLLGCSVVGCSVVLSSEGFVQSVFVGV